MRQRLALGTGIKVGQIPFGQRPQRFLPPCLLAGSAAAARPSIAVLSISCMAEDMGPVR